MFNGSDNVSFLDSFDGHYGEDQYLLGSIFPWKTFIRPNIMLPPLLNTILLVGLDVLIEII
jgi:hypothetical protein